LWVDPVRNGDPHGSNHVCKRAVFGKNNHSHYLMASLRDAISKNLFGQKVFLQKKNDVEDKGRIKTKTRLGEMRG